MIYVHMICETGGLRARALIECTCAAGCSAFAGITSTPMLTPRPFYLPSRAPTDFIAHKIRRDRSDYPPPPRPTACCTQPCQVIFSFTRHDNHQALPPPRSPPPSPLPYPFVYPHPSDVLPYSPLSPSLLPLPSPPPFSSAPFPPLASPPFPFSQNDAESKRKAARSVAAYMQLSDAVFTPYAESLYPAASRSRGQAETRSGSQWWGSQTGGSDLRAGAGRGSGGYRRRASSSSLELDSLGKAGGTGEEQVRTLVVIFSL